MADDDAVEAMYQMPGAEGDSARADYSAMPLASETPADVTSRQYQADTATRAYGRIKAADLNARGIPSYTDTTGAAKAYVDNTGAPLTNSDPKNEIAYDTGGNAVKYSNRNPTLTPTVTDAYDGATTQTDKQGNVYATPKGLPWVWQGQDPQIAAQAQQQQQDKLNQQTSNALAPYEQQAKIAAAHAQKAVGQSAKATQAIITQSGAALTDPDGDPVDLKNVDGPTLKGAIQDSFDREYAAPAANEKPWFGGGQYSSAATAIRADIDNRKQRAMTAADTHIDALTNAQQAGDAYDQIQQQRIQLASAKLDSVNQSRLAQGMEPVSIPGLENAGPTGNNGQAGAPSGSAAGSAPVASQGQEQTAIPGLEASQPEAPTNPPISQEDHQKIAAALPAPAKQAFAPVKTDADGKVQPEGFWATAGRAFGTKIIPSVATAAGGLLAGTLAIESGPGAIAADIAGGTAAGYGTAKAQRAIMGDKWANENDAQMAANAKAHPVAAQIGTIVPFLVSILGGGGGGIVKAGEEGALKFGTNTVTAAGKQAVEEAIATGTKAALPIGERVIQAAATGARGGGGEAAQDPNATAGSVADSMAKNALAFGATGLFAPAKTILGSVLGKAPTDAAAMALAGSMYDTAIHGQPFDINKIAQQTGANIPAFMLQNALLGFLGHGMAGKSGEAGPDAKASEAAGPKPTGPTPAPETPQSPIPGLEPEAPARKGPTVQDLIDLKNKLFGGKESDSQIKDAQDKLKAEGGSGWLGSAHFQTPELDYLRLLDHDYKPGDVNHEPMSASEAKEAVDTRLQQIDELPDPSAASQERGTLEGLSKKLGETLGDTANESESPTSEPAQAGAQLETQAKGTQVEYAPEPKTESVKEASPIDEVPEAKLGESKLAESAAKDAGIEYQGKSMGLHAFKEPETGGNFSIPEGDVTPEKVKAGADAVKKAFADNPILGFGEHTEADIDRAIAMAKGSHRKEKPAPLKIGPLDVSIENGAGTSRKPEWPPLTAHYGSVMGTKAGDGDKLDVFVKPGTPTDYNGPVYVSKVQPNDPKAIIGAESPEEAAEIYNSNYPSGLHVKVGDLATVANPGELKQWAKNEKENTAASKGTPQTTSNESTPTGSAVADEKRSGQSSEITPEYTKSALIKLRNGKLKPQFDLLQTRLEHLGPAAAKTEDEENPPSALRAVVNPRTQKLEILHDPIVSSEDMRTVQENWKQRGLSTEDAKKQATAWMNAVMNEELIHARQLVFERGGPQFDKAYAKMWREQIPEPIRNLVVAIRDRKESDAQRAAEYERMVIQYRESKDGMRPGTITEVHHGSPRLEALYKEIEPYLASQQDPAIEDNIARVMTLAAEHEEPEAKEEAPKGAETKEAPKQEGRGPPSFSTAAQIGKYAEEQRAKLKAALAREYGVDEKQATTIMNGLYNDDGSDAQFERAHKIIDSLKLSEVRNAEIQAHPEIGEQGSVMPISNRFKASDIAGETDPAIIASALVNSVRLGGDKVQHTEQHLATLAALLRAKETGMSFSDIAKYLDELTTRNAGTISGKEFLFSEWGKKVKAFADEYGIELPAGDLEKKKASPKPQRQLAASKPQAIPGLEEYSEPKEEQHGRASVPEGTPTLEADNATVTGPSVVTLRASRPIVAFHGTPHTVDRFDSEKIGTGEGARAFGYGLYFAESRAAAESYRAGLSRKKLQETGDNATYVAAIEKRPSKLFPESKDNRIIVYRDGKEVSSFPEMFGKENAISHAVSNFKTGVKGGNTYTVQLNADPKKLLDWDKDIGEQTPEVKAALSKHPVGKQFVENQPWQSADFFYSTLVIDDVFGRGEKAQSEGLRKLGIPGIKYLDGVSRTGEGGTSNYVMFDDSLIQITHANGQPVALAKALAASKPLSERGYALGGEDSHGKKRIMIFPANDQGYHSWDSTNHPGNARNKKWRFKNGTLNWVEHEPDESDKDDVQHLLAQNGLKVLRHRDWASGSSLSASKPERPDTGKVGESESPVENLMREAEAAGVIPKTEELKGLIRQDPAVMAAIRAKIKIRTGEDALWAAKPLAVKLEELSETTGLTSLIDLIQKGISPDDRLTQEERLRFATSGDPNAIGDARKTGIILDGVTARAARKYQQRVAALKEARELISKLPEAQQLEFMLRVDEGTPIKDGPYSKVLDQFIKMDKQQVDAAKASLDSLGMDHWKNFENYQKYMVPHYFENADEASKLVDQMIQEKKRMLGSTDFLKHRADMTMREVIDWAKAKGIELKPKNLNLVDAYMERTYQQDRFFGAHEMIQAMERNGTGKWQDTDYVPKRGEKMVNNIIGNRTVEVSPASTEIVDGRVVTTPAKRKKQFFFAAEPSATIVNNYLSKGLRQDHKFIERYFQAANVLNAAQLSLSAFHGFFVTTEGMVSGFSLGLEKVLHGDIKGLKDMALAPFSTWHDWKLGGDVRKTLLDPTKGNELHQQIINQMVDAGFRGGLDSFYKNNHIDKFWDAIRQHKIWGTALHAPLAAIEYAAKPIMEHFVPRMKAAAVYKMAAMMLARRPNIGPEEFQRDMQEAVRSGNNRFGEMTYDNLHLNKVVKDLLMAVQRSVGWNWGDFSELGGGLADWAKFAKNSILYGARKIGGGGKNPPDDPTNKDFLPGGKKFPRVTHRMAYVLALPLIIGFFGALLSAMFGQSVERLKDLYFVKTGEVDDHGHAVRVVIPSYMKDVTAYSKHPLQSLVNKLHPILSAIGSMLMNKDYYGISIRNEGDPVLKQILSEAQYAGKQFLPFSFTNAHKLKGSEVSTPLKIATGTGALLVAPSYAGKSDAQNLADDIVHESMPTKARTQEAADHSALRSQLVGLARIGKGQDEMAQAVAQGKLDAKDVAYIHRQAQLTPLQASVSHLGLPDALKVEAIATPKEQQELRPMIAAKSLRAGKPMYRMSGY